MQSEMKQSDEVKHFDGVLKDMTRLFKNYHQLHIHCNTQPDEKGRRFWRVTVSNSPEIPLPANLRPDLPELLKFNVWGDYTASAESRPQSKYIALNVVYTLSSILVLLGYSIMIEGKEFDPYIWPQSE